MAHNVDPEVELTRGLGIAIGIFIALFAAAIAAFAIHLGRDSGSPAPLRAAPAATGPVLPGGPANSAEQALSRR